MLCADINSAYAPTANVQVCQVRERVRVRCAFNRKGKLFSQKGFQFHDMTPGLRFLCKGGSKKSRVINVARFDLFQTTK